MKLSINLWTKKNGRFAVSHKQGLTKEQVDALKQLREGDQLVVYNNTDKKGETSPDFTLRVFIPREDIDGGL